MPDRYQPPPTRDSPRQPTKPDLHPSPYMRIEPTSAYRTTFHTGMSANRSRKLLPSLPPSTPQTTKPNSQLASPRYTVAAIRRVVFCSSCLGIRTPGTTVARIPRTLDALLALRVTHPLLDPLCRTTWAASCFGDTPHWSAPVGSRTLHYPTEHSPRPAYRCQTRRSVTTAYPHHTGLSRW